MVGEVFQVQGMRNAAIDLEAVASRGVTVCGTDMLPYPTAELTWGLILAFARNIAREDRAMREGKWQTTIGSGLLRARSCAGLVEVKYMTCHVYCSENT